MLSCKRLSLRSLSCTIRRSQNCVPRYYALGIDDLTTASAGETARGLLEAAASAPRPESSRWKNNDLLANCRGVLNLISKAVETKMLRHVFNDSNVLAWWCDEWKAGHFCELVDHLNLETWLREDMESVSPLI
jgi:hypothetical protein